jgi:D-alanyl-D-alanine carboxypeptidase
MDVDAPDLLQDWAKAAAPQLDAYLRLTQAPSAVLALVDHKGHSVFVCRGVADLGSKKAVTPQTLYQIGSISKTVVALLVLQAAEAGRCKLSDAITQHLPWLTVPGAAPISILELLTHTSGLRTGMSVAMESQLESRLAVQALAGPQGRGDLAAGTFYYSNIGWDILGYMLEALHQQPLAELLQRDVFEPLGMHTSLGALTHAARDACARGYTGTVDDAPRLRSDSLSEAVWEVASGGAGCIASSAQDMAQFVAALLNNGAGLVREDSFKQMCEAHVITDRGAHYGLGLFVKPSTTGAKPVVQHTGGMLGFRSVFAADLSAGFGMVLLTNLGIDHHGLAGWQLAQTLVALAPAASIAAATTPFKALEPSPDEYAGRYGAWQVQRMGDALQLIVNGHAHLLEGFAEDRFVVHHPTLRAFELHFQRDAQGRVFRIEHGAQQLDCHGSTATVPQPMTPAQASLVGTYRSRSPWSPVLRVVSVGGELKLHVSDLVLRLSHLHAAQQPHSYALAGTPEVLEFSNFVSEQCLTATLSDCPFHRVSELGIGAYREG